MSQTLLQIAVSLALLASGAWLSYVFAVRQKNYDALIAAKLRHYETISPLLNAIFRFRMRVGDYLDVRPEDVLAAKRAADEEFYTHAYIWGNEFRRAYSLFMQDSFLLYVKPRALIRAESTGRMLSSDPTWRAYTDIPADRPKAARAYQRLMEAIAKDLPFVPTKGEKKPLMYFTRSSAPRHEVPEDALRRAAQRGAKARASVRSSATARKVK